MGLRDCATPRTVVHQAPLFMGFSRQEYWSGLLCPPPEDLPEDGRVFGHKRNEVLTPAMTRMRLEDIMLNEEKSDTEDTHSMTSHL